MKKILLLGIKTCLLMASVAQHHNYFKTHGSERHSNKVSITRASRSSGISKQTFDSIEYLGYDSIAQQWKTVSRYIMKYNDKGFQSSGIYYEWYDNAFGPYAQEEFLYDSFGRLVEMKYTSLVGDDNVGNLVKYQYNAFGLLIADTTLQFHDQARYLTEYEYGPKQELIKETNLSYNAYNSTWYWQNATKYTYNALGQRDTAITYNIYSNDKWYLISNYNIDGYKVKQTEYFINDSTRQLQYSDEYIYDEGGNLIKQFFYSFGQSLDTLDERYMTEFVSDFTVLKENLVWPKEIADIFNYKLIDLIEYRYVRGQWEPYYKAKLYYSGDEVTQSLDQTAENVSWYDFQNCVLHLPVQSPGKLQVYDLQGRLALQQTTSSEISLQHLSPGFYTYLWLADGQQKQGKILR